MSTPRIAFLGLGLMGGGMARRLLGAGFAVTVFNRNPARAEPLAAAGARVAGSPREAAAGAEVVFSMVADDAASRAIWLGPDGAIAGAARGAVLVECSTLTVAWVQELAQAAAAAGAAAASPSVSAAGAMGASVGVIPAPGGL